MFYTYLIQSRKNNQLYVGSTSNLKRRLKEHNSGLSEATKNLRPWKLIYYEAYSSLSLATQREKQLKIIRYAKEKNRLMA